MLIALSPTRRVPTAVLASRFKLVTTREPQRRWMNLEPHKKSKWRTLPWDQKVYLRLLQEHKHVVETKQADDVAWGLPLIPYTMRRGTILHAHTLKHYVILLNGVSLSAREDDPKQEPVLTADVYMVKRTHSIGYQNNPWRVYWSDLDRYPMLEPDQAPWDIHIRSEYDLRPEDNPSLPLTKVSRLFDKECSRPIVESGPLTIPIKHLHTPVPRRWFSATEESMARLDPFTKVGPMTRDFIDYCPALSDPDVGLIDAHYHGRSDIFSRTGRWPFENRTCLVFSHQGDEPRRMASAAQKLARTFKESGRVRTAKVAHLWLNEIIQKVLPNFEHGKIPDKKTISLCRILIARALEKWRGTTILIRIPKNMPKIALRQLVELASSIKEDTAVMVAIVGRKPYSHIFDHESDIVRETFATEIVFRPPLKPALIVKEEEPEANPEEDAMMRGLMEKFLSQNEQREMRKREEAERRRRQAEHQRRMAEIQREMEERRQVEIRKRIEEKKQAEERRRTAEQEKLKIRKGVEGWYETAVQYEIEASLREQEEMDTMTGRRDEEDLDRFPLVDDADKGTEEAHLSEGSISIENGDICIEKEGSITVMDGYLNKRDGSIVIKTGFVNMDSGTIVFLRRSDLTPFREDLTKMSISFEDGVSRPASGESTFDKGDLKVDSYDEAESHPDLIRLTDAVINITDGSVGIEEGSIKVIGEEGFDDAKKILSSIRIKKGAIHIVSGSAAFKGGKEGFINCSFDISETTLGFKDGYSDVKEMDDSAIYSVRDWGAGYEPRTDSDGFSYNSWSYEPFVEIRDTARERVFKKQEAIEKAAWREENARRRTERAEEKARVERERAEEKVRIERERAEEEERLRKERLAKKRAEMLARLPMSFLPGRKPKR
ncbi:hypothetical protein QBC36DRAFT_245688 [Triangularia setosa]|uniref:Uncharacterized protein n=1 Tax=Triangularia setosa TaxID=2587417 RepID=A0AAN6W479_9PEZI|nr:hypothetical protein QBC36DRAFT_245688 [Podospora setosa]